ncbi:hypothetical protein, partial [Lentilactobacillus parabuchneri]
MHSDIGLSNVAHHRHFNKSIIISLMIGLSSLLFGMFLSGLTVNADANLTPFKETSNFDSNRTYPANRALHFAFNMNTPNGGKLQLGDKIKFTIGSATDGSSDTVGLDVSTTRIDFVSSNSLFDVQTDSNSNPATITITPKANAHVEDLAKAEISLYVNTSDQIPADNITRSYPLKIDFISHDGTTYNYLTNDIKIAKTSSNDNNPDNPTSAFGNEIFGGIGGLPYASGFSQTGEDQFNGNYYSITDSDSDFAGSNVHDALIYSYNQPNFIAWAQTKLPTASGAVPSTVKWTISIPKRQPETDTDGKAAPYFPAYSDDNEDTLHAYLKVNDKFVPQDAWKFVKSESSPTKLVFEATGLTDEDKGKLLNIPFDIRTSSPTDMCVVTSEISYNGKSNPRTVQMKYNSTSGAGFVPYFQVQDQTMTLSEARKLLYNNDHSLKSANEIIGNDQYHFIVALGDYNVPSTQEDDKVYFDQQFDTSSLSYDKVQAGHSYPMWVYAANSNGRQAGYRIANLIIEPEINGEFIDVDSGQVVGTNPFPINKPENMSDGDTTPVTRSFLNDQNITIPSGYHFASGSELNGNQQPNITWGKTQSPVKIYVKKT